MGQGDLDRALTLAQVGDRTWRARADPNYESANGMFGGWTAALALRAVSTAADGEATPASITVGFIDRIIPGTELALVVRRVGGGRSVSHWQCEVASTDGDRCVASASVVLANRRDTDGHVDVAMPDAPDPDVVPIVEAAPGSMGARTTLRPVAGFPPFARPDTRSLAWVRETSGRPIDHLQLAYLVDHRPPRSFFWAEAPRVSATMTMSVWFHATDGELAEVGDDELLSEAFGVRGANGTSEEHLRLWSRTGVLLASSAQLCWYR